MHIIEALVLDDTWQRTETFCPQSACALSILRICVVLRGVSQDPSLARVVVSLDDLKQLMQQAIAILKTEATVVDLPAPCKVFGDIHGQFTDLKKFFATYGESS